MIEIVLALYDQVFDEKGEVLNCGREKCIELIIACKNFMENAGGLPVDYGNTETGMMNVENIKKLVKALR